METGVFQQQHLAVLAARHGLLCRLAYRVGGEADGALPALASALRLTGFSDMAGTTLPLGRSKWLNAPTRAPFSASSRIGGGLAVDARRVGYLAIRHRHVQVGAHPARVCPSHPGRRDCGKPAMMSPDQ